MKALFLLIFNFIIKFDFLLKIIQIAKIRKQSQRCETMGFGVWLQGFEGCS